MKRDLKPGIYDLPTDEYHADQLRAAPSLSASLAALLIDATPAHAYAASRRLNPDFKPEGKAAFDIGSAVHELMLGKGGGIRKIEADDYRKPSAQAERDKARLEGYTPLTIPQVEQVERMMQSARSQMQMHGIGDPFKSGRNEMTLLWDQDGVSNRIMVDCLDEKNRVAYDLKTLQGVAEPERWVRRSMEHAIDLRAAHYLDGLKAIFGSEWTYRFVLIEKDQPHCLSVVQLSEAALFMGRKKIRRAREIWGKCLASNSWPGWSSQIAIVDPPPFYESRWLERESADADYKRRTGRDVLEMAMAMQAPEGQG